MPTLYFDESGYTGRSLLDPVQPHFVIASSVIGDDEARDLLRAAFPDYQGAEFKFRKLWARPASRRRLVNFAEAIGRRAQDLFVWNVDKKFCVLVKMIDFLMEPTAYDAGFDFYHDAFGYKLANYVHFGLVNIGSDELYTATVEAYYTFARNPTPEQLEALRFKLMVMANSAPEELHFFFRATFTGALTFHDHYDLATFRDTMDIYLTSMLAHVGYWATARSGRLLIRHDRSNAFFAQRDMWEALMSPDVPLQHHPVANGPPMQFPLPVDGTDGVDSNDSPAIQLCDILAGLSAKAATSQGEPEHDGLFREIFSSGIADVPLNGINPGLEFPEAGPARRDGPDSVDRMGEIIKAGRSYRGAES